MNSALLTGSTGFVGSALLSELKKLPDFRVVSAVRSAVVSASDDVVVVGNINGTTDYSSALNGVDVVVHSAARAHVMRDEVADPLAEYRKVNVEGTLNLAKQAVAAGVKRFVFISTIGVHGLNSSRPFKETDTEAPHDAYAISKYEAEQGLRKLATEIGLEVVIIRPPLVYGGAAPGNFRSLINLTSKSVPLPFGAVNNHRSMVYVGNLVSFIIRCIQHPAAANQTFLVSDGEDVSLRNLVTYIRLCLGRSPRLLPVPVGLFKLAGALTGKRGVVDRLVGDLQVDSSKARTLLEWVPPFTVSQGIEATVADFMSKEQ
ncbi:SDR family oxidoreductase [Pseudomonas mendocina]|nr:SDR family oxidoreductase [Pseudomonas mendocina]MDV5860892.1 SDR family oxidoreductase [Pseudomonas mendocina]